MSFKKLFILLLFLVSIFGYSQNMQEGFNYLETGKYAKAETYFTAILKDYPDNKTARLCLGRAIGLNGKAEDAKVLFTNLLADYPTNFEVKLNYG